VNISGHVNIGEEVSVGTGSKIIQNISIGRNTIIGAGAIVTKDIPENVVAVGMPAKPIKSRI
jgi:acetyltransferase-like isoleucine patch superfamily enzyme